MLTATAAATLIGFGVLFYAAGTIGLLRFPDVYSRLHALTKADNTGLGFIALGVALLSESGWSAALIALIWLLAMAAASIACHLLARHQLHRSDAEEGGSEAES